MIEEYYLGVFKTRQWAQNGVAYAKSHITGPRLNYGLDSSGKGILKESIRSCQSALVKEVICAMDPSHSLKGSILAITNLFFFCLV